MFVVGVCGGGIENFQHFTFFFLIFSFVFLSSSFPFFFRSPRPLAAAALGVRADLRAPAAGCVLAEPLGAAARRDGGDGRGAVLRERGRGRGGEEEEEDSKDGGEEERERRLHFFVWLDFLFLLLVCAASEM